MPGILQQPCTFRLYQVQPIIHIDPVPHAIFPTTASVTVSSAVFGGPTRPLSLPAHVRLSPEPRSPGERRRSIFADSDEASARRVETAGPRGHSDNLVSALRPTSVLANPGLECATAPAAALVERGCISSEGRPTEANAPKGDSEL